MSSRSTCRCSCSAAVGIEFFSLCLLSARRSSLFARPDPLSHTHTHPATRSLARWLHEDERRAGVDARHSGHRGRRSGQRAAREQIQELFRPGKQPSVGINPDLDRHADAHSRSARSPGTTHRRGSKTSTRKKTWLVFWGGSWTTSSSCIKRRGPTSRFTPPTRSSRTPPTPPTRRSCTTGSPSTRRATLYSTCDASRAGWLTPSGATSCE